MRVRCGEILLHLSANVSFADVTGRHARGGMAQEAVPVGASGARRVRVRPVGLATFRSWLRSSSALRGRPGLSSLCSPATPRSRTLRRVESDSRPYAGVVMTRARQGVRGKADLPRQLQPQRELSSSDPNAPSKDTAKTDKRANDSRGSSLAARGWWTQTRSLPNKTAAARTVLSQLPVLRFGPQF
jgi:hypothetical protein